MARVKGWGELDWVMHPQKGFVVFDGDSSEKLKTAMGTDDAINALKTTDLEDAIEAVGALIFAGIRKTGNGSELQFELHLDAKILRPTERYQEGEVANYGPQGFEFAYILDDGDDDDNDTSIGENQLGLPFPLRSALAQIAVEWDVDIDYSWDEPNRILIEVMGYKEKIRYPSKFVAALARKLSRWANDSEVIAKRCLSEDEIGSCLNDYYLVNPVTRDQIEKHLKECSRCSEHLRQEEALEKMIEDDTAGMTIEDVDPRLQEIARKFIAELPAPPRQSFARRWWNERLEALAALKKRCRKPGRYQEETQ